MVALFMASPASAATVTVSQAGADSGSVMKGVAFTISVSGLSGSGTVSLTNYPSGFSVDGEYSKSFSDGTTSVTWTTASINQLYESAQIITASIETLGSPSTADSNSFTVKLSPSLVTSLSHSIPSIDPTGSKTIQLTTQNWGETTANDVSATISLPTGVTLSSGSVTQTKSTLSGGAGGSGESWGISWVVSFGTMTAGSNSITIQTSASNADTQTDTISFTVSSPGTPGGTPTSGPGGGAPSPTQNVTNETTEDDGSITKMYELKFESNLANREGFITSLEEILGKLSDIMKASLKQISDEIKDNIVLSRNFRAQNGKSTMKLHVTYNGQKTVENLVLYDILPKSFAENAANIMISAPGATVRIVKADPEFAFIYPTVIPGQELTVTYDINEEKNESVIDETFLEVYGLNYQGETLADGGCNPGLKRCSDDVLEQCNGAGTAWIKLQDCSNGCNSATLECNPASGEQPVGGSEQTSMPTIDLTWVTVIIIVIIIIVVIIFVVKKRRIGDTHKPVF